MYTYILNMHAYLMDINLYQERQCLNVPFIVCTFYILGHFAQVLKCINKIREIFKYLILLPKLQENL